MSPTGSLGLDALLGGYRPGTITYFTGDEDCGRTLIARAAVKAAETALYIGRDWPTWEAAVLAYSPHLVGEARKAIIGAIGVVDLVVLDDPQALDLGRSGWADDHHAVQDAWFDVMREVGPAVARSTAALLVLGRESPPIFALERRASTFGRVHRLNSFGQGIEKLGHWVEISVGDRTARAPLLYTGAFDTRLEARRRK